MFPWLGQLTKPNSEVFRFYLYTSFIDVTSKYVNVAKFGYPSLTPYFRYLSAMHRSWEEWNKNNSMWSFFPINGNDILLMYWFLRSMTSRMFDLRRGTKSLSSFIIRSSRISSSYLYYWIVIPCLSTCQIVLPRLWDFSLRRITRDELKAISTRLAK